MNIGSFVWKPVQGILRFGTIVDIKFEPGWAYFRIEWHNDALFERTKKEGLGRKDLIREPDDDWHRCDYVSPVDVNHLRSSAKEHEAMKK